MMTRAECALHARMVLGRIRIQNRSSCEGECMIAYECIVDAASVRLTSGGTQRWMTCLFRLDCLFSLSGRAVVCMLAGVLLSVFD